MFGQKKHLHLKYLAGFYPYQTSFTRNKSTRYFLFRMGIHYTFCISIIPPPFLAVVKKRLRPFTLLPLPFFSFLFPVIAISHWKLSFMKFLLFFNSVSTFILFKKLVVQAGLVHGFFNLIADPFVDGYRDVVLGRHRPPGILPRGWGGVCHQCYLSDWGSWPCNKEHVIWKVMIWIDLEVFKGISPII